MHFKKSFRCAVGALLIVFMLSSTALAAIPNNTIIFKDKAYDLSLLNDASMVNEILGAFIANFNNFYYKNPAGNLIDSNASSVNANVLPAVTYNDANKNTTQYAAGDGPKVEQGVTVTAITAIPDIEVANGTALAAAGLPATLEVTRSDNTKANVAVTWDGGTPAYSATTAGTYIFSGAITLPAGVTNPANLKASVKAVVAAAVVGNVFVASSSMQTIMPGAYVATVMLKDGYTTDTVTATINGQAMSARSDKKGFFKEVTTAGVSAVVAGTSVINAGTVDIPGGTLAGYVASTEISTIMPGSYVAKVTLAAGKTTDNVNAAIGGQAMTARTDKTGFFKEVAAATATASITGVSSQSDTVIIQ